MIAHIRTMIDIIPRIPIAKLHTKPTMHKITAVVAAMTEMTATLLIMLISKSMKYSLILFLLLYNE